MPLTGTSGPSFLFKFPGAILQHHHSCESPGPFLLQEPVLPRPECSWAEIRLPRETLSKCIYQEQQQQDTHTCPPTLDPSRKDPRGRGTSDLQAEGRVTLLEHQVPDVQGPIHLGSEENCWSHRAPGSIREVSHVVPVGARVRVRSCGGGGLRLLTTPLTEALPGPPSPSG